MSPAKVQESQDRTDNLYPIPDVNWPFQKRKMIQLFVRIEQKRIEKLQIESFSFRLRNKADDSNRDDNLE